jgi:hypothetical protein
MADTTTPTPNKEKNGISYPQDYWLESLIFVTSSGSKIDLKQLLVEFSYYEDIYSFTTSGHITILDAKGFLEVFKLTGNEFLEVNFGKTKAGANKTQKTFRVYKIGDRFPQGNQNSELYTLYFCSEELLLSEQNKVSKSYKGKYITDIVKDILSNYLKVSDKKIDKIEDTFGTYDFIVPRLKPLEAISWLSTYARPKNGIGADMLFFETKYGFSFKSLQSMFKSDVYTTYKYHAKNLNEKTLSMEQKLRTVLDYEFNKPYDILNDINSGAVASRTISIDPLARTYKVTDFDINKYKEQATLLNKNLPLNDLKNRLGKKTSESSESVVKVVTSNAGQQVVPYIKETDASGKDIFIETYVPNRTAQISLANYTSMKISIPGDPGISAGRTINFNLLSLKQGNTRELDNLYSGKYLVTAVRHLISVPDSYQTILEICKDSSVNPLPNVNESSADLQKDIKA